MAWFTKKNEAASLPIQEPVSQTIHNHAPNPAWEKVANFAGLVFLAWLGWLVACYFADILGSRNPERDVAATVLWIGGGGAALWFASRCVGALIDKGGSLWKDINKANRDAEVKIAQYQLQASVTGAISDRALDSDYALARGALAVLATAYKLGRPYNNNESRPWVRDNAWGVIRKANITGLKWADCSQIRGWLEENGFIIGDQLNRKDYPEFEDARREIDTIAAPRLVINNRPTQPKETTSIIN